MGTDGHTAGKKERRRHKRPIHTETGRKRQTETDTEIHKEIDWERNETQERPLETQRWGHRERQI